MVLSTVSAYPSIGMSVKTQNLRAMRYDFQTVMAMDGIGQMVFQFLAPKQSQIDSMWHRHVERILNTMMTREVYHDKGYNEIADGVKAFYRASCLDRVRLCFTNKMLQRRYCKSLLAVKEFVTRKMTTKLPEIFRSALLSSDCSRVAWAMLQIRANPEQFKTLLSLQQWQGPFTSPPETMSPLEKAFSLRRNALRSDSEEGQRLSQSLREICESLFSAIATFGFPRKMCSSFEYFDDEREWFAKKMKSKPEEVTRGFLEKHLLPQNHAGHTVLSRIFQEGRILALRDFYLINRDAFVAIIRKENDLFAGMTSCYSAYMGIHGSIDENFDTYCAWFVQLGVRIPNLAALNLFLRGRSLRQIEQALQECSARRNQAL